MKLFVEMLKLAREILKLDSKFKHLGSSLLKKKERKKKHQKQTRKNKTKQNKTTTAAHRKAVQKTAKL